MEEKTLLEIERELNDVLIAFEDTAEGGVDAEEYDAFVAQINAILDEIGDNEKKKIDAYGHLVTKLEAEQNRLAEIIKNVQARKKSVEGKVERVKSSLLYAMNLFNKPKIEGEMFVARIINSEKVVIEDESALPDDVLRVKTVSEPDKKLIKERIKAGGIVSGATVVPTQSVTIK